MTDKQIETLGLAKDPSSLSRRFYNLGELNSYDEYDGYGVTIPKGSTAPEIINILTKMAYDRGVQIGKETKAKEIRDALFIREQH